MAAGIYIFLACFGGYLTASIILLFFPTLLHKKKKISFKATHISHRGGAGERLENTMEAFRHAASLNTDMFEIDVQLTKDGVVVVSHDDDLRRVTGQNVLISECNYADLPPISSTLDVTFAPGNPCTCPQSEGQIALFQSILEEFPDIALNIDTKDNDDVIEPTVSLIRKYKREHNVVMVNVRKEAINKIHATAPDLLLGMSFSRTMVLFLSFYIGLLPFLPMKESFCELFLPSTLKCVLPVKCWQLQIADALLMRPVIFKHLQRRGVQVNLFVINSEANYDRCFDDLGVDGVMSDYPTKLREYLSAKKCKKTS